jgi:hypothetical protein
MVFISVELCNGASRPGMTGAGSPGFSTPHPIRIRAARIFVCMSIPSPAILEHSTPRTLVGCACAFVDSRSIANNSDIGYRTKL